MTAAVGSAPPGGSDALMQTVSGKASVGHRSAARRSEESDSEQHGAAPESAAAEDLDASGARVDKSRKPPRRDHGKADSDDDQSFEDTFDTIGQTQGKDAGAASARSDAAMPSLLLVPVVQGDPGQTRNSADGKTAPSEMQQSIIRPTAILQQKSILALLNAKDKQAAIDGDLKTPVSIEPAIADQSISQSDDETELVPMTVDRLETHWNFGSNAITNAASQISDLQSGGRKLSEPISLGGAASEEQPRDADGQVDAVRLNVPVGTSREDQSSSSSFLNDKGSDRGGAQAQVPASAVAAGPRKDGKAESADPLDKIFKAAASPQPGAANITTQVRDGVIDSLKGTGPSAAAPDLPARPTSAPVMKSLDLTLSPPDLGSVKLRLSLKSDSLTIEAEASKASTAKLLSDDRQNLERGLKDAGYDVSSMKITDASASSSSNSSGWQPNGSPSRDGDQTRSGFAGQQEGGMQRRDSSSSDQSQRRSQENNPQPTVSDTGNSRLGNAVYI